MPFGIKKILFFLMLPCLVFLSSCFKNSKTMEQMKPYTGPAMEIDNIETIYSDLAIPRVKLTGAKQIELQNGNREFPKGVVVEFYDESGAASSVLTANFARYYKDMNKYLVTGNVIVKSIGEHKTLKTEELNWDPIRQKIFTEKFVTIETAKEILTGQGLEAKEDFSSYKILKPTGILTVE